MAGLTNDRFVDLVELVDDFVQVASAVLAMHAGRKQMEVIDLIVGRARALRVNVYEAETTPFVEVGPCQRIEC